MFSHQICDQQHVLPGDDLPPGFLVGDGGLAGQPDGMRHLRLRQAQRLPGLLEFCGCHCGRAHSAGHCSIGGQMQAMQDQLKQILPQIGQQFAKIAEQQAKQAQQIGQLDAGQTALAAALNKLSSVLESKAPEPTPAPVRQPAGPAMPGGRVNAPGQPIAGTTPTLRSRSRATAVPLLG